jgi:hypothetical protein
LVGSPFHADAGLHPIRTLLERRCGIDRSTGRAERLQLLDNEIRAWGLDPPSTVPALAPVLGIEAQAGYEPVAAEGRRLYELIARGVRAYLLACLAGEAGLVVAEDVARERLDTALALAQDTGMHFYDAELLRLRAHTQDEPALRLADINGALELARRQTAALFELRAALDDFEHRGKAAADTVAEAASHIPANSALPELARAQALIGPSQQDAR